MPDLPNSIKDAAVESWFTLATKEESFMAGVQWLFDYLMKSELEFDEKAAAKAVDSGIHRAMALEWVSAINGARWQFEQLKGRLLLYHYGADEMIRTIQEQQAKIAELEANIASLRIMR